MEIIPTSIEELLELLRKAATRDEPNRRFRLNNGQLARVSYVRDEDREFCIPPTNTLTLTVFAVK
jgi:hypothetical protein